MISKNGPLGSLKFRVQVARKEIFLVLSVMIRFLYVIYTFDWIGAYLSLKEKASIKVKLVVVNV